MTFDWINIKDVDDAVIKDFDSGNYVFNDFLKEKARNWQNVGEAVTYLIVDADEILEKKITRVYGFVAINAIGLLYEEDHVKKYLPCAEIRMFAIAKQLRKRHDITIEWSDIIFKTVLQNLYFMSTSVIGFRGIFLNANHDGYKLYTENGFGEIANYISPDEDEKIEIDGCIPLLLIIDDEMLYDIFA